MRYFPGYKEGSLTRTLLVFSLFSIFTLLLVTNLMTGQLYASTLLCDRFDNASDCEATTRPSGLSTSSSSTSATDAGSTRNSVTEDAETPLILPDVSPTEEDLGDTVADDNPATTSSGDSDSDSSNNNDDSVEKGDSPMQDSDNEESDTADSDNGGGDSSDGPSLIPFP